VTRDHVPPKNLFAKPRPSDLITVPSCLKCNGEFGKDDEQVRNIITSLENVENHPSVQSQLAKKRNRSLERKEGKNNLRHLTDSLKPVDLVTDTGKVIERRIAFDLDQPVMDRFAERVTRGLLYHESDIGYTVGTVKWRIAPDADDFDGMPKDMKEFLSSHKPKSIGNGVFKYIGYVYPGRPGSLWLFRFFDGFEIMTLFQEPKKPQYR